VIADGTAAEIVFTLRRRPGLTDDEFKADAAAVSADLARLKHILGNPAEPRPSRPIWPSCKLASAEMVRYDLFVRPGQVPPPRYHGNYYYRGTFSLA
jgi:hypothetical protein